MAGTRAEAATMIVVLAIIFALLGSGIAAWLFVLQWIMRRLGPAAWSKFMPPSSIATAVMLPAGYLAFGATIYFWEFRTTGGAGWYQRTAILAIAATSAAALLSLLYVRLTSHRAEGARERVTALLAGGVILAATVMLFLRFPPPRSQAAKAYALQRVAENPREKRKLLVIGIDGGTWNVISPLVKQGRLPTLDSLIRRGVHGDVEAPWPPHWSIAAWAAIVTGHDRGDVGVSSDVHLRIPGFPAIQSPMDLESWHLPITAIEYRLASANMIRAEVPGRESLRKPPIWELLSHSGIRTAVIRFNFTHPAAGQAAFVISNFAMSDMWRQLGVRAPDVREMVDPVSRLDELLAPFLSGWKWDSTELTRILPDRTWPKPKDAKINPVRALRGAFRFDDATTTAALRLMEVEPSIEVLFVHIGGLDTIEHIFWPYRFPEQFENKPAKEDVVTLGPVIDRYMEFVDKGIGKMIASFSESPNVIVVSDHGQAAREDGVPFKGWHASPGIFVATGPDIVPQPRALDVTYFDIMPTILELKGLKKPEDIRGQALLRR